MKLTQYPRINKLIIEIKNKIQLALGEKLVGMYLYGSATAGDFDSNLSDVDLLAVIGNNLTGDEFNNIKEMHRQIAVENPKWKDRIEVVYVTLDGLKNFKNKSSEVAEISPGEPFHLKEIGDDWLINWYILRQNGVTLFGPEPKIIIPDISIEEYKDTVKKKALLWKDALIEYTPQSSRGSVAYAVFTLCRAMYSYENGEQTSKIKSAKWSALRFPQWKVLIDKVIEWRKVQWRDNQEVVGSELPKALDFLKFAIEKITTS